MLPPCCNRRATRRRVEARDQPAPQRCIDAVAAAVTMPFDEGLAFERRTFLELVETPESRALRHAFFAERAAARIPGVPETTPTRKIATIGVIGAGTMGTGIAMNGLSAGIPVVLLEMSQEALDRGVATIRRNYEASVERGKLTREKLERNMALLAADARLRRSRRRRSRHRGRVRGDGSQARGLRRARSRGEARRDPRDQYVDAGLEPDRGRDRPAAGCDRNALLQSRQCDEASRGRPRRADGRRRADDGDAAREEDRKDGGGFRCVRRIHRQPDGRALSAPGDVPAGGGRLAAAGGRCARSLRHGDGPVPDERSRRQRRRLAHSQAPVRRKTAHRLFADRRPAVRSRPFRAENRQRLVFATNPASARQSPIPRSIRSSPATAQT